MSDIGHSDRWNVTMSRASHVDGTFAFAPSWTSVGSLCIHLDPCEIESER